MKNVSGTRVDQSRGVGQFGGAHADVVAQAQLAQVLDAGDERFLQTVVPAESIRRAAPAASRGCTGAP